MLIPRMPADRTDHLPSEKTFHIRRAAGPQVQIPLTLDFTNLHLTSEIRTATLSGAVLCSGSLGTVADRSSGERCVCRDKHGVCIVLIAYILDIESGPISIEIDAVVALSAAS